jgi:hypothetical protein
MGFELLAICLFFFSPVGAFKELIHEWVEENKSLNISEKILPGKNRITVMCVYKGNFGGNIAKTSVFYYGPSLYSYKDNLRKISKGYT